MLQEDLHKFGLSEKEVVVYLAALKQGKASPAHIARTTQINRATVYSVAKELVKKGFLTEDLAGKTSSLVATTPADLKFLILKQEKELAQKRQAMDSLIGQLQDFSKAAKYAVPKISFIQEEDLEDYLYKRSDEWHASIMRYDGILWGFQDHSFAENYEKWINWEWEKGGPKDLQARLFSNQSIIEEKNKGKNYQRRAIKYWTGQQQFTATVWVHGDYLILVQTQNRPHYLVEIYDSLLSQNMREFFSGAWENLK